MGMAEEPNPVLAALRRQTMAIEAASSVSLSHPEACRCVVCRAALGDTEALAEVMAVLDDS